MLVVVAVPGLTETDAVQTGVVVPHTPVETLHVSPAAHWEVAVQRPHVPATQPSPARQSAPVRQVPHTPPAPQPSPARQSVALWQLPHTPASR